MGDRTVIPFALLGAAPRRIKLLHELPSPSSDWTARQPHARWVDRMNEAARTIRCGQERLLKRRPDLSGVTAMSQNRSCGSYGPGHLMHWIQGKKSHDDGQPIIKVKVVAVHDDGRVEIEGDELKLTLWYHDPDHLRSALIFGGRAEWKPRYHVLYVISSGSFNLATVDKVKPCVLAIRRRPTETTRQFIERSMRENHGYTVPQHWLADLDAIPEGDTGEPQSGPAPRIPLSATRPYVRCRRRLLRLSTRAERSASAVRVT